MSWALEAIEKAAMQRASAALLHQEARMLGYSPFQIAAFDHFFRSNFSVEPTALDAQAISARLKSLVKK